MTNKTTRCNFQISTAQVQHKRPWGDDWVLQVLEIMSLKLSEQLDADATTAFALYEKYVENNRWRFPESVLWIIENADWSGGYYSKSPHDGELKNILISGIGTKENRIELVISKPWEDLEIQINYLEVFDFNFPNVGLLEHFPSWRYEQFKYYDPYHTYGIKNKKMFIHEIEWVSGVIWSITASEIEVIWKEVKSGESK